MKVVHHFSAQRAMACQQQDLSFEDTSPAARLRYPHKYK